MKALRKFTMPLLFVLVATQSGILIKRAWDDAKLERNKYEEVSERNPVCLAEKDAPSAFIIFEADEERQVYRGVRVILFASIPFERSFRELNSQEGLVRIDCYNGKPIEE
jgi:hypothetical protein